MECTHGEDQTDNQGLYWRKGSDKELITYAHTCLDRQPVKNYVEG